MNRIEVIKKRASTSALNQAAWIEHYRGDVQYLLSKLKQAEEAFLEINGYATDPLTDPSVLVEFIKSVADKALKDIRE